jgi:hypothetical protein
LMNGVRGGQSFTKVSFASAGRTRAARSKIFLKIGAITAMEINRRKDWKW